MITSGKISKKFVKFVKSFSKLRIYSKPDRNQSKLTMCSRLWRGAVRRRRVGCSGERMLRLGCDCYCALRPALLRLLLPTPFLKLGGKQKALFKDSGLRTFPHAFDSLSSKPFIARQSKRSLPRRRRRAAAPTSTLYTRVVL